jgi:hypothetical protein
MESLNLGESFSSDKEHNESMQAGTQRGQRPQPNTHRRDAESAEKRITYAKILKEFQKTARY